MMSVCLQWVARLLKKRQGAGKSANQASRGLNAASQMAGNNYFWLGAGAFGENCTSNQLSLNNARLNAVHSGLVEVDEGRTGVSGNLDSLGALGHPTVLLTIREDGEAYDLSGRKWSPA